jgi:hypothetical protein
MTDALDAHSFGIRNRPTSILFPIPERLPATTQRVRFFYAPGGHLAANRAAMPPGHGGMAAFSQGRSPTPAPSNAQRLGSVCTSIGNSAKQD